ncbi:putative porin [Chryseosolibacter indicus]|uniref:Porin n=1 Tax=Chryseosolibacter indicus TaxID=2782351 RepID=A0ABS5VNG0_9BACT|nr:hypothetical protein [Chryseosolibacter indicus]
MFIKKFFWLIALLVLVAPELLGQNRPIRRPSGGNNTSQNQSSEDSPKRRGSRVIDDTTKQVYGPNTSRYYYEEDVFYNRNIIYPIDTLIRNFHRFNYVQRNGYLYQDLGTIGTAIQPIYYQVPKVIGVRSGFHVYDLYWDNDRMRYFDTKSPYSNMNVILGGNGRSLTKVTFSRNISSRWNFGINYRGLFIDKQIPQRTGKGDRAVRSNYYDIYTAFHTKDSVYRIFASYRRMYHQTYESGGVKTSDPTFEDYFQEDPPIWLTNAQSSDLRMNLHFHQELKAGKALQAYHTFDRYRQRAMFFNLFDDSQEGLLGKRLLSNDSTYDKSKFKTVRNEFGIKGNLLKLFYNGYYAIKHYSMTYNHALHGEMNTDPKPVANESILGGRMELRLDSIGYINGWAEVNQFGNYRIEGRIASKWFEASLKQMQYQPGFLQQFYRGSHNEWSNDFSDIQSSQINGFLHYKSKVFNLSPGLTFTRLKNYSFFEKNRESGLVTPVQSSGSQVIFSPEYRLSITFFKRFTISNNVVYTRLLENADDAIRVPELFVNAQLAYSGIHFNGNFDIHVGVDLHWNTAYYAPAYQPALMQFYNQDDFKVKDFPQVEPFINAKIKRGRIFVKYNNLMQVIQKTGYFPTPDYPGQRNVIDFGFDWSFYD